MAASPRAPQRRKDRKSTQLAFGFPAERAACPGDGLPSRKQVAQQCSRHVFARPCNGSTVYRSPCAREDRRGKVLVRFKAVDTPTPVYSDKRSQSERPIIFIGHSFGGLIIKKAFLIAQNDKGHRFRETIFDRVIGFIFLGTPHRGAFISYPAILLAVFTRWQGSSTKLLELLRPKSDTNKALRQEFMEARQWWQQLCCVSEAVPETFLSVPLFTVSSSPSIPLPPGKDC